MFGLQHDIWYMAPTLRFIGPLTLVLCGKAESSYPEGPDSPPSRTLVPLAIPGMVLGPRALRNEVRGPLGLLGKATEHHDRRGGLSGDGQQLLRAPRCCALALASDSEFIEPTRVNQGDIG